jgi:hypothetical protein
MTAMPVMSTLLDPQNMEAFQEYVRLKIAQHRWTITALARCAGIDDSTIHRLLKQNPETYRRITHVTRQALLQAIENPDNYVDCGRCNGTGKLACR